MSQSFGDTASMSGADTSTTGGVATATQLPPQEVHHAVVPDICRAVALGDFAGSLGPAGGVTQIVISFIPGVGTLAAIRDFVADVSKPEPLGIVLNGLSMLPVLGGFSKTAEVMNRVQMVNESFVVVHGVRERQAFADGQTHDIPRNRIARWSVAAAFFAPLAAMILLAAQIGLQKPLAMLWYAFALPLLAIVFGHWGKTHAKHLQQTTPGLQIQPGRFTAGAGAALGWLGLIFFALIAVVIVLLAQNAAIAQYL
ncbi:MAG TPA: hypothetical protein VF120_07570 [Ktedonobacterales bacterium]